MSYTYAILEISSDSFNEIKNALKTDYGDQFHKNDEFGEVIDMHGIALATTSSKHEAIIDVKKTISNLINSVPAYRFHESGLDRKQSTIAQTVARKIFEEILNDQMNRNRKPSG